MQTIRKQAEHARLYELCKGARARHVIWNLALPEICAAKDDLPSVSHVDVFLCHSWSSSTWMKMVALCHYLYFHLALSTSAATMIGAVCFLVIRAGSLTAVSQESRVFLMQTLVGWPVAVFLLVYFCGYIFDRKTFWFDRLCVNQGNLHLKTQTLQAVPAFVAEAEKMLVLWDDTLCGKLWCVYEMAIRAKTSTTSSTDVVPVSLPVWTLLWTGYWMLISLGATWGARSPIVDLDQFSGCISLFFYYFGDLENLIYYPLALIPLSCICLGKIDSHKRMLDQMASFDLRDATCTLETDRIVIKQLVLGLFDEAVLPPLWFSFDDPSTLTAEETDPDASHPLVSADIVDVFRHITSYPSVEEIINEFNSYVRGPLRDRVIVSLGTEEKVPLKLCLLVSSFLLPFGLVNFVGCDGHTDCETAAKNLGFQSVGAYFAVNLAIDALFWPLSGATMYPLMLRAIKVVTDLTSDQFSRILLGSLASTVVVSMNYAFTAWLIVCLVLGTCHLEPLLLAVAAFGFTLQSMFFWQLVARKPSSQIQRSLAPRV